MFYWNKKEAVSLLQRARRQSPSALPQDGFVHSIRKKGANVKWKFEDVTESKQFKRWFGDWQNAPKKASKVVNADGTPKVVYHGSAEDFVAFDRAKNYIQTQLPGVWDKTYKQVADKYAELETVSNIRGTKAVLEAETMAEIASTLATDEAINQYGGDVSFGRNVALWFSYMAKRVKAVFSNLTDAEKLEIAARKWEKALKKAEKGKQSGNGVMFDTGYGTAKQVHDALSTKGLGRNVMVYMGGTPNFYKGFNLIPGAPVLVTQGHVRDMNHEKVPGETKYHGLDETVIADIPNMLKSPVLVYDSISENGQDAICVLTEKRDEDELPIILILKKGDRENSYLDLSVETVKSDRSTILASAYGKDSFLEHFKALVDADAILYADKKRTQEFFPDDELQLLMRLKNFEFNKILHQTRNIVNTKKQKNHYENTGSFNFSVSENASGEHAAETQQDITETQQNITQTESRRQSVDDIEAELDDIAERLGREDLSGSVVVNKKEDAVFRQDRAETALAYPRASSEISLAQTLAIVKAVWFSVFYFLTSLWN